MRCFRWLGLLAVVLGMSVAVPARTAPVPGKKSALGEVPATAPVVAHLRGVDGVADRLIAYLKNALPDQAAVAEAAIKGFLTNGFGGRSLKGLPKDGPILIALLEMPQPDQGEPRMAVIAAVTSYAEFRDNLLKEDERKGLQKKEGYEVTTLETGMPIFFLDRTDYAVVTPQEDVARQLSKKGPGLDTKISPEQSARLLGSDFGVYLSMDTLNKQYAEQIKAARSTIEDGIKAVRNDLDKGSQKNLDMVVQMIGPAFQAVEDSKGLVLGLQVQPTALALHLESEMRDGSATSKSLQGLQAAGLEKLAQLPAGQMFYVGMETNPAMLQLFTKMVHSAGAGADSDEAKAIAAAIEELAKTGPQTQIGFTSLPLRSYQACSFQEPQKALDAQMKILEALGEGSTFSTGAIKGKPVIKRAARKFRDVELHEVAITWDLEKMSSGLGTGQEVPEELKKQMKEMMKKLMGEKTNVWVGVRGKEVIQVTADSWAVAEKVLAQVLDGENPVGKQASFQEARKSLPEQATLLGVADLPRYLTTSVELVKPMLAGQLPIPPNFPAALPADVYGYVGVSATLQPERASFDLTLTATAVKACYRAFVTPFIPADL